VDRIDAGEPARDRERALRVSGAVDLDEVRLSHGIELVRDGVRRDVAAAGSGRDVHVGAGGRGDERAERDPRSDPASRHG
jgi:hypothetical protein